MYGHESPRQNWSGHGHHDHDVNTAEGVIATVHIKTPMGKKLGLSNFTPSASELKIATSSDPCYTLTIDLTYTQSLI